MPFRAPVTDFQFLFDHVVDFAKVTVHRTFCRRGPRNHAKRSLLEAGKMVEEVMAPVKRAMAIWKPAVLENGVVRTSRRFMPRAYKAIR